MSAKDVTNLLWFISKCIALTAAVAAFIVKEYEIAQVFMLMVIFTVLDKP